MLQLNVECFIIAYSLDLLSCLHTSLSLSQFTIRSCFICPTKAKEKKNREVNAMCERVREISLNMSTSFFTIPPRW